MTRLLEQIRQTTQGGSRLLCALARRGKALERDERPRAEFLLTAVRSHPLYKGGRLAFDMLELEDIMLDGLPTDSISTLELTRVLSSGGHNLVEVLRRIGSDAPGGPVAVETSDGQPELRGRAESTQGSGAATALPRVSLGPAHDVAASACQFTGHNGRPESIQPEPELTSSDYLYDFVVLGFLDVLGGIRMAL